MDIEQLDIAQAIRALGRELDALLRERQRTRPVLVGIHTGGVWVAAHLHAQLALLDAAEKTIGKLNIAFYRDDFSRIGLHPKVSPSALPFTLEGRHVVLVDDVLHTGRTARAAMNELFDYGRPASITFAVLLDRGGHELPVRADVAAVTARLDPGAQVKLLGPEPLALQLVRQATNGL